MIYGGSMSGGQVERGMTGGEALMWSIERDPWLAPSGGSVTVFDRPLDMARFRRLITHAVASIPRLRQKVVDPATALGTPHWEFDPEFDLEWHLRRVSVPGEGSPRDLLDWATPWLQDPYDRSRPLWQYVVIDGLADGRGALAMKLHHVVTDGHGAVRLAGEYTGKERHGEDPPEVDLEALLASQPDDHAGLAEQVRDAVSGALRVPAGATRALADALTHPERLAGTRKQIDDLASTASDQLHQAGSPLWVGRSRRRHLEALSLQFAPAHDAANALGGTVNDLFVAGAVEGAVRYHQQLGAPLEHLHISFVVSTRGSSTSTSNAFTPVPVDVPAGPMPLTERVTSLRDLLRRKREEVHGDGPLASVAALANLLPTSVVTGIARSQAGHIDFATSNLPGYLGDSFVAGAQTEHTYIFGPVAGTAFNLTAYSTAGCLDLGINADPAAVAEPERLRSCMEAAYADLIAAGASRGPARARKRTPR
jgi:diacylglycerol O-acyltransferase / wax synthase